MFELCSNRNLESFICLDITSFNFKDILGDIKDVWQ